ncbi:MAG TPA: histidine kinase, partial [Candidatus Limnocylindria bacterium]|nr:histidine kinase [Candidatus Limnocylindria bacterium]
MDPASAASSATLPSDRWRRFGWLFATLWLFYLAQPISEAWHHAPVRRWTALAAIVTFAAVFVGTFAAARSLRADRRRMAYWPATLLIAFAATLAVTLTLLLGPNSLALFVYVGVMAIFLLPNRIGPFVVLTLAVGTVVARGIVPGWRQDLGIALQIVMGGLAMFGVVQVITRNRQLADAHDEITRLAVEDERTRFARDLHDILGHSLTVVAVKAELAGRLVRLDPGRAEIEIKEVEDLARQALGDVRSAVAGYRDVTLATELANARSALQAAGIDAELPVAIDEVPTARRELFGWVVREGVTNVLRHSGASRCHIRVGPS